MLAATILSVPLFAAGFASGRLPARLPILPSVTTETVTRTVTVEGRYRGRTAASWAHGYRRRGVALRRARGVSTRLRRTLMASPSVGEAISLAGATYGSTSTLWAIARCESGLNPHARNPSGSSGLMQFMPSTFASTPYAGLSIWSPYASALAAGWMLQQGRRREWVC